MPPLKETPAMAERRRLRTIIHGAVQGVGFRPFVYRLAQELGLPGWVINDSTGVQIEVEGTDEQLVEFNGRLVTEHPPLAVILSQESTWLDPIGFTAFEIRSSQRQEAPSVLVLPDVATCDDCRNDIFEKGNRRYGYWFTNCTNCGPRFSIIKGLPYDRPSTTMAPFKLCPECQKEYTDPKDRRFHAQPNACGICGPQIAFWDPQGQELAKGQAALDMALLTIGNGRILALKGLGGYQLLVDARNTEAVARLRKRKHREQKPLAVMFPSMTAVKEVCVVGQLEAQTLTSVESPIVLLQGRAHRRGLAKNLAPDNPYMGVMLPYTPLHHLLLRKLGHPVVATSGNLSEEPMAITEEEALQRLGNIADGLLVHDRPILRAVDDSIVRVVQGREMVLRRARGFAPLPITFGPSPLRDSMAQRKILAVGSHLKNTVALAQGGHVFLSQHIGDLATLEAHEAFQRIIADLSGLLDFEPERVVCDMHPDFLSTQYAVELADKKGLDLVEVQHHEAHIAAAMAENDLDGPVLGFAWDGTGMGRDGTVWGGECFTGGPEGFTRTGHLRTFRLPGGDRAAKEPCRVALALLHQLGLEHPDIQGLPSGPLQGQEKLSRSESKLVVELLEKDLNTPITSSMGRLFDGVSSLLGLKQLNAFEGQAAMALEFCLPERKIAHSETPYPMQIIKYRKGNLQLDWEPMLQQLLIDLGSGTPAGTISARFHNGLAEGMVSMAQEVGLTKVVLSGGCFQNMYLTERAISRLGQEGFKAYTHQRVPPNDGGIALGQAVMAAMQWDS